MAAPARILALDLATRVGWATWSADRGVGSGVKVLPTTGEDVGRFVGTYMQWLDDTLALDARDLVVFEAPWIGPQTSQDTARKLLGLAVGTEVVCWRRGLRCLEQSVPAVRKHFVGNGRLPRREAKAAVIAACRARGWTPKDDNDADALALLDYAAHLLRVADFPRAPALAATGGIAR